MTDILARLATLTHADNNSLRPCPFCEKTAQLHEYEAGDYHVYCDNAESRIDLGCLFQPEAKSIYDTKEEAVAAWNTRPREAALIALVQEAAGKIERVSNRSHRFESATS